jgi:AcrR family transcriptional regulator
MPLTQRPYHHGNLRQALIDMAVTVAEETGKDIISVREVARRLGVSSGAPFRHFPDRESLMTAVAEEALARLRLRAERDQLDAPADPITRLKTLGRTFIRWALQNPTQFRLVSSRSLFEFDRSARLPVHFDAVRLVTLSLVEQAQLAGQLPAGAPPEMALALRALVYGLARMQVDGQLPQWRVDTSEAERTLISAMNLIVDGLSLPRPAPS